jgi:demethylmenaquinone methyltransferase/2-methoxy-6-polyprenyl-1,4-benzoquinol methylase
VSQSVDVKTILNDKSKSWSIFDAQVSKAYDFVSDLISLGLYRRWCTGLAKAIPSDRPLHILDLATGTGLIPLAIYKQAPQAMHTYVGVDLSTEMLSIFEKKLKHHPLSESIQLQHGDATQLDNLEESYDVVTMACGLRNVGNTTACLKEIYRVLKPGGCVYFLEPSFPKSSFLRSIFIGYFRYFVPLVAGLFSNGDAYRYFNQSVEHFPYGQTLVTVIEDQGFEQVKQSHQFAWGAGALYVAYKPEVVHDHIE